MVCACAVRQTVRWISIVGVNVNVIMSLATKFGIHHLMVRHHTALWFGWRA